jgi:hypothetical protein
MANAIGYDEKGKVHGVVRTCRRVNSSVIISSAISYVHGVIHSEADRPAIELFEIRTFPSLPTQRIAFAKFWFTNGVVFRPIPGGVTQAYMRNDQAGPCAVMWGIQIWTTPDGRVIRATRPTGSTRDVVEEGIVTKNNFVQFTTGNGIQFNFLGFPEKMRFIFPRPSAPCKLLPTSNPLPAKTANPV